MKPNRTKTKPIEKFHELLKSFKYSFEISWKASKLFFILRIFIEMILSILPLLVIFFSKRILDVLVESFKIEGSEFKPLLLLIIYLFSLEFLMICSSKLSEIFTSIHKDLVSHYVNKQLIKKSSQLDIAFFDSPHYYDKLLNVRRDSSSIETLVWGVTEIIRSTIQIVASGIILFSLSPIFPILFIVLNIPSVLVEKKFTAMLYKWKYNRAPEERKLSYIQTLMTERYYAKEVRLFNLINPFYSRYSIIWKKWFKGKQNIIKKRSIWTVLAMILPKLGILYLTVYVVSRILDKVLSIGDFIYFTGMGELFMASLFILMNSLSHIYDNKLRISNYIEFLSWQSQIQSGLETKLKITDPAIVFDNVSFKYPNTNRYILKDLNLTIKPGEKIALVGLNGAGKSTIVKLLLRFYDPTEGQIRIDGRDMRDYSIEDIRRLFGVLFQDYSNYAFTVRENIGFSDYKNMDNEAEIRYAAEVSGANEFIESWPAEFDTYLTKQFEITGKELSGGQWKKIALARAFFRKSSIMILDEPSSNLDPEAEHKIFQHFAELCKGKGAIFISHRLSSTIIADKILVLENGKIIEFGSHIDLLTLNGRYAYLFGLQANKYKMAD